MSSAGTTGGTVQNRVHFSIVTMLFLVALVNYADRDSIAIARRLAAGSVRLREYSFRQRRLLFTAANALVALVSYPVVVGEIRRSNLRPV